MKLSAILEVFNEERCLLVSLPGLLDIVNECIIIDGNEDGPSTDNTKNVIDEIRLLYPDKIIYRSGRFERDDGAWDDTAQSNLGFELASGDFLMRTHADIIYDPESLLMLRDIVGRFPDKKYFYCPFLEFFWDTQHVALPSNLAAETCLLRPMCGDVVIIAASANPHFEDLGQYRRSSLQANIDWQVDTVYMPHIRRFHFSHVKSFKAEVLKIVRYIKRGDFDELGAELLGKGMDKVFDWAIDHVRNYEKNPFLRDFAGVYPQNALALRPMKTMDGYLEFMDTYKQDYGL